MPSHHKGEETPELVKYNELSDTLTVKPRALDITWGGDSRYWKISPGAGPAELVQVSWLQVNGKAKLSYFKKGRDYAVRFRVELRPDNFGWGDRPVYLMSGVDGQRLWRKADLGAKRPDEAFDIPMDRPLTFRVPVPSNYSNSAVVEFGMYEIWRGRWKGGLVIHEVVIEPVGPTLTGLQ
ncbi:Protein PHLOEM PROTEIN 2-LIKE A9 [Platanthera zijinensis]|uniref:Protein PHLOEM PROTEIN 2-LIKE A9 n=1 Tax=Platanthera zijinensis TaxID=2320716 RepID=A0AAP0B6Y9_9ASPA